MNILLMVDIEGISGIYCREQVVPGERRFDEGRRLMTGDVNACVEACKEAGADRVYVRDCHGGSYTLIYDELSDKADYYICGISGDTRFPEVIHDCDGVILLGYHAMAGTKAAVLEHTYSSADIQNIWVNGKLVGETAIDAGILGDMNVPVIMISGDDKVCREAKEIMPWVETAEVKKGTHSFGAMLLPQKKALKVIREKTIKAIKNLDKMKPLVFPKPIHMRVEKIERRPMPNQISKPYMKVIDGRTFEVVADTMEEAFFKCF